MIIVIVAIAIVEITGRIVLAGAISIIIAFCSDARTRGIDVNIVSAPIAVATANIRS